MRNNENPFRLLCVFRRSLFAVSFFRGALFSIFLLAALAFAEESPRAVEGVAYPFKEVVVGAPAQKVIERIAVKEGDAVREGDLLAALESAVEKLDVMRYAKILEKREFENDAAEKLAEEKFISKDEALERSLELEIARLQHEIAVKRFEILNIKSPITGIVVEQLKEAGESVTETEPMFLLVNVERVFVQFFLPPGEVFLLKEGQQLDLKFEVLPEVKRAFAGVVDFISPVIDRGSRLLRVKVLVENPDGLIRAGMRAKVALPEKGAP